MAYEDYRINPSAQPNPWALQGPAPVYRDPVGGMMVPTSGISSTGTRSVGPNNQRQIANHAASVGEYVGQNRTRMQEWLRQQGADVSTDLGGELDAAFGSGSTSRGRKLKAGLDSSRMTAFQDRYNRYMLGRQRAGQARGVDAMMADPRRLADRQGRLNDERTQGMRGIAESFRIGKRNNSFNQARRGTQGSSMDIEQGGDLARGRDRAGLGLQAGLTAKAQQYRLGDQQQRAQLMGLIYNDDPSMASAFASSLDSIDRQGASSREMNAQQAQAEAARRAEGVDNSRAIGSTLNAASDGLGRFIDNAGGGA